MTQDSLRRDDLVAAPIFDTLPADVQTVLKRAANRGTANGPDDLREIVDRDWIMVPTKKGQRQVVVTAGRAYRL